MSDVQAG